MPLSIYVMLLIDSVETDKKMNDIRIGVISVYENDIKNVKFHPRGFIECMVYQEYTL
jgi:hypothetical protein